MPTSAHCRCGHSADAHDHLWAGHECALCRCLEFDAANARDLSPLTVLAPVLLKALAHR